MTGEDDSRAITSEPDGYDGTPVTVDVANVGRMAHHIAAGFHVYGSEMEDIGTVKQYNREEGEMLVERGALNKLDIVVAIGLVSRVDRDDRRVYLSVSSADLMRDAPANTGHQKPGEVVLVKPELSEEVGPD